MSKEFDASTPYFAAVSWDEEAGVWYISETDFPGLVAEAETRQQLLRKIGGLIPGLRDANRHLLRHEAKAVSVVVQQ